MKYLADISAARLCQNCKHSSFPNTPIFCNIFNETINYQLMGPDRNGQYLPAGDLRSLNCSHFERSTGSKVAGGIGLFTKGISKLLGG